MFISFASAAVIAKTSRISLSCSSSRSWRSASDLRRSAFIPLQVSQTLDESPLGDVRIQLEHAFENNIAI
jgi:hypothetical protein